MARRGRNLWSRFSARARRRAESRWPAEDPLEPIVAIESRHAAFAYLAKSSEGRYVLLHLFKRHAHAGSNLGVKALTVFFQVLQDFFHDLPLRIRNPTGLGSMADAGCNRQSPISGRHVSGFAAFRRIAPAPPAASQRLVDL